MNDPLSQAHSHLLNSAMNYAGGRLDAADRKATLLLTAAGAWAGFVVAELRPLSWPETAPLLVSLGLALAALSLALSATFGRMSTPKGWFAESLFGDVAIDDLKSRFASLEVPDLFADWLDTLRVIGILVRRKTRYINSGIYCLVGSVLIFLGWMALS